MTKCFWPWLPALRGSPLMVCSSVIPVSTFIITSVPSPPTIILVVLLSSVRTASNETFCLIFNGETTRRPAPLRSQASMAFGNAIRSSFPYTSACISGSRDGSIEVNFHIDAAEWIYWELAAVKGLRNRNTPARTDSDPTLWAAGAHRGPRAPFCRRRVRWGAAAPLSTRSWRAVCSGVRGVSAGWLRLRRWRDYLVPTRSHTAFRVIPGCAPGGDQTWAWARISGRRIIRYMLWQLPDREHKRIWRIGRNFG